MYLLYNLYHYATICILNKIFSFSEVVAKGLLSRFMEPSVCIDKRNVVVKCH